MWWLGETSEKAARRELLEETGLTVGELHPLWSGPRPYEDGFSHTVTVHVFHCTTSARQEDVVLGEGRAGPADVRTLSVRSVVFGVAGMHGGLSGVVGTSAVVGAEVAADRAV